MITKFLQKTSWQRRCKCFLSINGIMYQEGAASLSTNRTRVLCVCLQVRHWYYLFCSFWVAPNNYSPLPAPPSRTITKCLSSRTSLERNLDAGPGLLDVSNIPLTAFTFQLLAWPVPPQWWCSAVSQTWSSTKCLLWPQTLGSEGSFFLNKIHAPFPCHTIVWEEHRFRETENRW